MKYLKPTATIAGQSINLGILVLLLCVMFVAISDSHGQVNYRMKVTPVRGDEGSGQFDKLVIQGAFMIDGTGAPVTGPVRITVEKDKIVSVQNLPLNYNCDEATKQEKGTHVINACGMYVSPGFVDVHEHLGGDKLNGNASYAYKLWLAHGITTVCGVPFTSSMEWDLEQAKLSEQNKIVAPRLIVGVNPGGGKEWQGHPLRTPQDMRDWVDYAKSKGITLFGEIGARDPEMMEALFSQAQKNGIWTMDHLAQNGVVRMTAADAVKLGLNEITHFYGIFESMLTDHSIQNWPLYYNYNSDLDRFSQVGRLYEQSAEPGSKKWNDVLQLFLDHKVFLSPTLTIYSANRNVMDARNADWWHDYTLPSLWDFIVPNRRVHASYFYDYTSRDEASWQRFYTKWMRFVYDYNNAGGKISAGADDAFLYELFGFGFIRELKMLQYAGLTPFEVFRSATLYGAESIFQPDRPNGRPIQYGIIRPGLKADLQLFTRNPLRDFDLLYGTGAIRLNSKSEELERVRILKYVIKDGIIYDPASLLAEVRQMVKDEWKKNPAKTSVSLPAPMLNIQPVLAPADTINLYYRSLSRERNVKDIYQKK